MMKNNYLIAPNPDDPRLTKRVEGIDHAGNEIVTSVTVERPLTLFLNGQESVTLMTIGDYPKFLALGYLLNQNMIHEDDHITSIDYDADTDTVVVRTAMKTTFEEKVKKKIIIAPHIPALKKLNAMKDGKVWMEMIIKVYYVELTDVLRKYISGRLNINALEYTTDEIMDEINDTTISMQHKMELKELLQMSDLVKFAKVHPLPEEGEKYLITALEFVNSTKSGNDKPTNDSNDI